MHGRRRIQGRRQKAEGTSQERRFAWSIFLSKILVRAAALLVGRGSRSRWREEWLGEINAAPATFATVRRTLGAPADAWSTREPGRLFSAISGDVKYSWRQLIRRPTHSLAIVACLVVGLVVSIGTFSVLQSMFTGDQPGIHDRLSMVRLHLRYEAADPPDNVVRRRRNDELTLAEFALMKARELPPSTPLLALGAEGVMSMTMTGNNGPVAVAGAFASGELFKALATERGPAGRLLDVSDDVPDAAVAVVSEHFWRTHIDARPDAIGRQILITGMSFTVVGVAPPRFHGMLSDDVGADDSRGTQVWIPLSMASRWPTQPHPQDPWLVAVGRLKPGRTGQDAEAELAIASRRIAAAFPAARANASLQVRPQTFSPDASTFEMASAIFMIMLLPLTVLAIGCANVANLQLARVAERSRELAVRLSLGASRGQLIRLLTLETMARAFAAVAISIGLVLVAMRYIQPYFPVFLTIDARVALFAVALALVVAFGTGLTPAWLVLRKTAAGQLKQSAQSGGLGHTRLRATLIVAQVALSLGLLAATSLIVGAVRNMETSAPAALREQVVASFNSSAIGMTPAEGRRFADTLAERAANDGRVRGVALSWTSGVNFGSPQVAANGSVRMQRALMIGTTPSWLDVMDVKLLTGRRLIDQDDDQAVLLSAHAAEMVSPKGSALGTVLNLQVGPETTRQVRVVGIVADTPTRPTVARPEPVIYAVLPRTFPGEFVLRVRTSATEAVSAELLKLIPSIDSRVSWTSLRRGDMRFQDEAKFVAVLGMAVGACGTIALILSATGLFAVMSYSVMLRRREIGVRLAIGANPTQIVALVMRQAFKLVSIGAAVGLIAGIPLAFFMRAQFMSQIDPTNPMAFVPALAVLLTVGAIAAAVPSIRASRVDPISTLRQD